MKAQTKRNLMAMLQLDRARLLELIASVDRGEGSQMLADFVERERRAVDQARRDLWRVNGDIEDLEREVCSE